MPSYLAETFVSKAQRLDRAAQERRARRMAESMPTPGAPVVLQESIYIPDDEICFYLFEAPSARDVADVAVRAGLDLLRVVEVTSSRKEMP